MGNTELRPIRNTELSEYFVDKEGFLWRRLSGRPRNKGNSCYLNFDNRWFILIKPGRCGKYKNYLSHNTGYANIRIHREVLAAFTPIEGYEQLQVNHKDRNTCNNNLDNLEWVTNQENALHRFTVDLPMSYDEMYVTWEQRFYARHKQNDCYKTKKIGGQQKYDKDMILELLANTQLTKASIALITGSSVRAVNYWQEKEKIKRYQLIDIVRLLLAENPNMTKQELVDRSGSLVTSVNTVLRQVKCNDYRKDAA